MSSKIDTLTITEAREIAALFSPSNAAPAIGCVSKPHYWEIGKPYLIRTVTMIDTGTVIAVTDQEIILEDAAWIADTGRFSDALKTESFNEVEPFPEGRVIVNRSAVIDAVRINKLPRSQK